MLAACAPLARWIDVFCEEGAFDADQSRAVLEAGRAAGLGLRVHGNQLGPGPGVRLAVELGAASVDHCTYLTDADVDALAGGDTVATFLPATDFSTRQPYPDARRVLDAGAPVAIATNCNPGSSYTTSMAFCLALAVRDMRMTTDEALLAATKGGARALRRDRRRPPRPRRPRRPRDPRRALLLPPRLPPRCASRGSHVGRWARMIPDPCPGSPRSTRRDAPEAARATADAHAATGGRMTNMKWTLAHSPAALDALLEWYPLHDRVVPILGERRTNLFCHAI